MAEATGPVGDHDRPQPCNADELLIRNGFFCFFKRLDYHVTMKADSRPYRTQMPDFFTTRDGRWRGDGVVYSQGTCGTSLSARGRFSTSGKRARSPRKRCHARPLVILADSTHRRLISPVRNSLRRGHRDGDRSRAGSEPYFGRNPSGVLHQSVIGGSLLGRHPVSSTIRQRGRDHTGLNYPFSSPPGWALWP